MDLIVVVSQDQPAVEVVESAFAPRYAIRSCATISELSGRLAEPGFPLPKAILLDLDFGRELLESWISTEPDQRIIDRLFVFSQPLSSDQLRPFYSLGAHDFLFKPLREGELTARIELYGSKTQPWRRGLLLRYLEENLTLTERRILGLFLNSEDGYVSRDEIMNKIWTKASIHPNAIDVHLFNLRKKLRDKDLKIIALGKVGRWRLVNAPN